MILPEDVIRANLRALFQELDIGPLRAAYGRYRVADVPARRLLTRVESLGWAGGVDEFVSLIVHDPEALGVAGQLFGAVSLLGCWTIAPENVGINGRSGQRPA